MENTSMFARQNSVMSLDAKLHQGNDPSLEYREQGMLFSNVLFDDESQKNLPNLIDASDKDDFAAKNTQSNEEAGVAYNRESTEGDSFLYNNRNGDSNNPLSLLDNSNGNNLLLQGSFGNDGYSQAVANGGDAAAITQQNEQFFGGDISSPSPSSVGGGGDNNDDPPNDPNDPPDDGDGVLTAPVVSTQPADGNENQPIPLVIQITPDNDFGVTTFVTIFGVPVGATLSAGTHNVNGSWTLSLADLVGLTLTPPANFSGGLGLSIVATSTLNGISASNSHGLSVTVEGVATQPLLSVQPTSGDENTAIPLTISAGLVDNDGSETLSIIISGVPSGSVLSAGIDNGNNTWTLTPTQLVGLTITPPVGFGTDFNLTVTAISSENGTTASISQNLVVTIDAVASTPNLSVQPATGDEGTPIALTISASLSDTDGSETLWVVINGVPTGATLSAGTNNGNGSWTLTPAQLAGLTITPPAGSDADFTLTVTAISSENGTTASVSQNLSVTVDGVATPPTLSLQAAQGNENAAIPLTISASLVDNDGSETLSITISGVPTGAVLSAGINNGNGSWTLTPAQLAGLTITPPNGSDADFTLTVTATSSENGTSASVSQNVTVVVDGIALQPILSVQPASGDEDAVIPLTINASLADNDGSETLSITISGVPTGAVLSAGINNGNGSWTLTPAQLVGLTITPPPGSDDDFTLTVTATSSENSTTASISQNLSVTIGAIASSPFLTVQPAHGNESTPIALVINASLSDTDGSETLSIMISGVPAGAILSAGINNGNGSWTLTSAQLAGLTITPPTGSDVDFILTVTAISTENSTTASVSQNLTVVVDGVATPPTLSVQPATGDEGSPISLMINASLVDNDGSETLSIVISGVPTGATLSAGTNNGNGSWTLTPAQLIGLTITPPLGSDADFTLTVTATSSENGTTASVNTSLAVTVDGAADAPILSVTAVINGAEDTAISLTIAAGLADKDGSETLSVLITGVPVGAVLSHGLNLGGGQWSLSVSDLVGLTITPPHNFSGAINLQVSAISTEISSGDTAQISLPCLVNVAPVADMPNLNIQAALGLEDQVINLNIQAALGDIDGSEILSVLVSGMPAGCSLSAGINNGNGSWTLTAAQLAGLQLMTSANNANDFDLTVTAISRESLNNATASQSATLHVTVQAVADMPTVFGSNTSGAVNTNVTVNIGGAVTDTDGSETITFVVDGVPDGFALNHGVNNGDNSWTLTASQLVGLTLIAPYNFEGRVYLTVQAVSHESEGDTEISAPASFNVGFGNAALGVQINLGLNIGVLGIGVGTGVGIGVNLGGLTAANGIVAMEDSTVHISDAAGLLTSILGLVSYLNFTGVPVGASFNHGTNMGGGVWRMSVADLTNLDLQLPPNSSTDFTLGFEARLLTAVTLPLASAVVHIVGVADVPTLNIANATGNESSNGIALNITAGLVDLDGSETLSILIKDLPTGFVLSAGIHNGDGSWSLTPAQLAGLKVIPIADFSGDVTYTVIATSTESEGDSSAVTLTGNLHINPVVDIPVIAHTIFSGIEDQAVALNLGITVTDTDGSEHISAVTISGVPIGSVLTNAAHLGGGVWSVDPAQLGSVQLTAPSGWHGDMNLSVTATSEEVNGAHASTTASVSVHIEADADVPTISVTSETGFNDSPIALHINAGLADNDGSEQLSIIIGSVPDGSILSAGLNNGNGTWTLHANDLSGLSISPPHNFSGDMHLTVTSVATESSNGDTANSATMNFTVHVDTPPFFMSMMQFVDNSFMNEGSDNSMFVSASSDGDAFANDASVHAGVNDNSSNAYQDPQHQAG